MIFGTERAGFTVAGALLAYAVVAGVIGVAQRSTRLRDQRVQRWKAVFYGGGAAPLGRASRLPRAA